MLDNPLRGSGCLPMCPTCLVCSPVSLYILRDIACSMGKTLLVGGLGCQHVWQAFGVCQYIIGCPLCFILCFLVVIMSQVSTTMAMTTTPPVTVVSSGMSSISSVTVASSLMGLPTTLGQHDVVLLPSLTPRCSGGVLGIASVPQQQPLSSLPLQAYANYAMGFPQVGLFCRVEPPTVLYIICLVSVLVSAF